VVLAAGTWGTQQLLFTMRDRGKLPRVSDKLGVLTRTNSESIVGAGRLEVRDDLDLTHGVAITSSIHPPRTPIEPSVTARVQRDRMLQTLMTDGAGPGGTDTPRWRQLLDQAREDPTRCCDAQRQAVGERTVIALVMQH
jgi:cholesterol oxidase